MNQTQPNQTSHLILLIRTFALSVWGSTVSTMTRIYTGRCGVQILSEAGQLYFLQNIQTSSSAQPASNSMKTTAFFSGSKVARADGLTSIICLEPSLQISGAIPPLNLSSSVANSGTTLFYLHVLPMYIYLNKSHPFLTS